MRSYIGTSGFSYPNWHGEKNFYPSNCKNDLEHYSHFFHFVEINNTFYKYPNPTMFHKWKNCIPKNFKIAVKANRFFTHMKRLKVDEQFIDRWKTFWETCKILKPNLGPILFQLHPTFKFKKQDPNSTIEKLKNLYKLLPKNHPIVFECRDTSWECEEVLKIFKKYNWCFCVAHNTNYTGWAGDLKSGFFPKQKTFWQTAKWGSYFRLHGSLGQYFGLYNKTTLNEIVKHAKKLGKNDILYTAFDNTDMGIPSSAIKNAFMLKKILK